MAEQTPICNFGWKAPSFSLPGVDGKTYSLADLRGKNGTLVITGLAHPESLTVHLSGADMVLNRKHVKGALFGDCNPAYDIKKMLTLYRAGKLKLDELVTKQYKLSEINDGYADLEAGKNIRGVIIHEH